MHPNMDCATGAHMYIQSEVHYCHETEFGMDCNADEGADFRHTLFRE